MSKDADYGSQHRLLHILAGFTAGQIALSWLSNYWRDPTRYFRFIFTGGCLPLFYLYSNEQMNVIKNRRDLIVGVYWNQMQKTIPTSNRADKLQ